MVMSELWYLDFLEGLNVIVSSNITSDILKLPKISF